MKVEIRCLRVEQKPVDGLLHIRSLSHVACDEHMVAVVGTQRERSKSQEFRHLIDTGPRLCGLFADVDCMACFVGRIGWLVLVVQKKELFTDLSICKADTAWEAGFVGCS